MNSLVQLPPSKPDSPLRYGVIKWIGSVPETTEVLAGIELVSLCGTSMHSGQ